MKVALVFPRVAGQVHGLWPGLGIISLGTVLKSRGHEVYCLDSSFDPGPEQVIQKLSRIKPELVGVSCLTDFFPAAAKVIQGAKQMGAVTVLGGPHPTIAAEQALREMEGLDFAVLGEGELSLPALLDSLEDRDALKEIPGIAFRDGEELVITGPPSRIEDLDSLPLLDRDLLDVHKKYLRLRAINLHASRGCPFNCRFCQPTLDRMFGKKLRHQSPERVAEEIKLCAEKYGVRSYFFHDDTFTVKKSWLAGLVEALGRAGLVKGYRYAVNSRVDTFDEERAALLKEMGVYYVLFGIETGSQQVLDSIGKGTTIEQAREAMRLCRRFGFRTHAYILLGSPAETRESLAATERFIRELNPSTIHVSIYTPLPGTFLADECREKGMVRVEDYEDFDYYRKRTKSGQGPIELPGLSYQELLAARQRILKGRRVKVFLENLADLIRDLARDPSLEQVIHRYWFYRRMQHYFG